MSATDNKQVQRNLIFNIVSLLSNVAVGVFYTPYLVKSLGIVAYGVVPLALIINQYISVVTGSLTSALTRFYSIALQKGEKEEASKYLSTSLVVVLGLIAILILPLWYLIQNVDAIFTIPNELVASARLLFTFTVISFFFSLLSSVFNITLYAYNRLDYLNVIKIIRVAGKLVFVILLFSFLNVNIAYVGLANLITEVIIFIFSVVIFFKFTLGLVDLKLKNFNKVALKAVSFMAFWVIVQQLGDTGLYRIDNLLINIFWSSKESGILGAFTELGNYSMIIASVIGSLFGPLILIAYSKNDHEQVKTITLDRSLSVGVMVAVMVGAIGGFSPIILKIWLGEEFVAYNSWLLLKLALVPFYSAAGVFSFVIRAWNKVRFSALVTVALGIINLVALYFLAKYADGDLRYVDVMLFVAVLMGIGQSYFLGGLYFSKLYKGTLSEVLYNFIKILLVFLLVGGVCYVINQYIINMQDVVALSIIGVVSLVLLIAALKTTLNKKQLDAIIALVYKN
jgi:membrane protein EpsK